jgi:hypothetical protein
LTFAEEADEFRIGIVAVILAPALELGFDLFDGPVNDCIGGVVEHLTDDFTPDSGVGTSLDLDERGDGILVKEQVIERPVPRPFLFTGHSHLTGDEQPTPRLLGVDLISGQEVRVISQELLQEALRVVRRLFHGEELGIFFEKVDTTSHLLTFVGKVPVTVGLTCHSVFAHPGATGPARLPMGVVLLGVKGEQFLNLNEDAVEDFFNSFALGVIGFSGNVSDEKLQVADCEHDFVTRRSRLDRLFDVLVQVDQPGQEQLAPFG